MNRTEALEQSLTLYRQNVKYEDIAKHLQKIGYVSERTRKPLTGQAVRHNIVNELKARGEAERGTPRAGATAKNDAPTPTAKEPIIHVSGEKADLLDAVRQVLAMDVSADYKIKVVKSLLS